LTEYIDAYQTDSMGFSLRGYCHMQNHNYQASLKDFERCIQITPDNYAAFLGKAEALERLEKYDDAFDIFSGLIKYAREPHAYLGRARCYFRRKDYYAAIKDYEDYISKKPSVQALQGIADCYLMLRDLEKSKQYFLEVLVAEPENMSGNEGLSLIAYGEKDYENAIKYLNKCIEKDPNPKLILKRAFATYETGDYDATIKDLEVVIKEMPFIFHAWSLRGKCHEKQGNYMLAIKDYDYYLTKEQDLERRKEFENSKKSCLQKLKG
jgi:tetratricopeptide (TPR) repeat protein